MSIGIPPRATLLADIKNMIIQFLILMEQVLGVIGGILDKRSVGGSQFHTNRLLGLIHNLESHMGCLLDKLSNIREEQDVIIDDFNFQDEFNVVVADDGDNISDDNINNLTVIAEFHNLTRAMERVVV